MFMLPYVYAVTADVTLMRTRSSCIWVLRWIAESRGLLVKSLIKSAVLFCLV